MGKARTVQATFDKSNMYRPYSPGVGKLLVVLCRSNVAKSLIVPTHPSPPYKTTETRQLYLIETFVLNGCKNRNRFKRIICLYLIKDSIFYEIIITVFQFTQRATENISTCHAWHACRRLPTPGLYKLGYPGSSTSCTCKRALQFAMRWEGNLKW